MWEQKAYALQAQSRRSHLCQRIPAGFVTGTARIPAGFDLSKPQVGFGSQRIRLDVLTSVGRGILPAVGSPWQGG